jgi:hypothetical protein
MISEDLLAWDEMGITHKYTKRPIQSICDDLQINKLLLNCQARVLPNFKYDWGGQDYHFGWDQNHKKNLIMR